MGVHGAASAYPLVRSRPPVALLLLLCAVNIINIYVVAALSSDDTDYSSGAGAGAGAGAGRQLLDFKSFLVVDDNGPGKAALDSWNSSSGTGWGGSPCNGSHANWVGVLCSLSGQVRGLRLHNMGLSGEIHVASLASFPYLRTLSFINNTFRGPLPPNINTLTALKSLYLSNNAFSGDIPPDAFAALPSLDTLFLQDNQFTGSIPSSLAYSVPRLRRLNLARNFFQGTIPNFQQKRLSLVTLSDNLLEGPIPDSLSHMPPTSFSGNEGLCDQPLMPCSSALISPASSPAPLPPDDGRHSILSIRGTPAVQKSSAGSKIAIIVLSIALALVALALVMVLCYYGSVGSCNSNLDSISSFDSESDMASPPIPCPPCRGNRKQLLTFTGGDSGSFDMHDLMRASAEVLGSGNFGASYKAAVFGGRVVVVKRYKALSNVGREEFREHMARLGRLCHQNLLPLLAYYYQKEEKLVVFDFVDNGSLASHLHGKHSRDRPGLDWPTRLNIIRGVAEGLAYLHAELPDLNLPHGHLKSSNVLLNQSFQPLLMDYALAPLIDPHAARTALMVAYKSPECAQLGRTHKKTDVFSLGVLILEVLTGKFPTSYLPQASGNDADLMTWVDSIARDFESSAAEVFDKDMGGRKKIAAAEGDICKLLRIGLACCAKDVDRRCDLSEVAEKVQQLTSQKRETAHITSLRSFELINAQHDSDGEFHHAR